MSRWLVISWILAVLLISCSTLPVDSGKNTEDGGGPTTGGFGNDRGYAYVTILSSENFLMAAKIVSYQLKSVNPDIPFVIFCTEDVSDHTMEVLNRYGAVTRRIPKFDTPFLLDHPGNKFQYTKMRLWCHTEYKKLVHLDLDTITVSDTSELFNCGDFCASVRHSDMFNSGVFVFRPDKQVCEDMVNASARLDSYDGGDQGFFNSYFDDLKYSVMFNPDNLSTTLMEDGSARFKSVRLSAMYNYDVGMYYLSGKILIQPKIIHYTLGPVKPWIWWSYPVFDLNWKWLEVRFQMESEHGHEDNRVIAILKELILVTLCSFFCFMSKRSENKTVPERVVVGGYERSLAGLCMLLTSFGISFFLVPERMWPTHAWIIFTVNMAVILVTQLLVYSNCRLQTSLNLSTALHAAVTLIGFIMLSWNILYCMDQPGKRYLGAILFIASSILGVNEVIKLILFNQQCRQFRYMPLRKQ